jgi:hypothetical protein
VGRITPPFRQRFLRYLKRLRDNYVPMLRYQENRDAFESIVRVWDREHAAMSNSEVPYVMDILNLTANVHNMSEVMRLERLIDELESRVKAVRRSE